MTLGCISIFRQILSFMRKITHKHKFKNGRMNHSENSHKHLCKNSFSALTNAFVNLKYLQASSLPVAAFLYHLGLHLFPISWSLAELEKPLI